MTIRRTFIFGLLGMLAAASAFADITGHWKGSIKSQMAEQQGGSIPAYMVLKQNGSAITGSAGGNSDHQFPIEKGSIAGDKLTIEASPKAGTVLRFTLVLKGNTISGDVEENGRPIGTASLERLQ